MQIVEAGRGERIGLIAVMVLASGLAGGPVAAEVEFDLAGGLGSERLAWSIGRLPGGPNVLSELTFQRTTTAGGRANLRWTADQSPFAVQLDGRLGMLVQGSVRDDDFTHDDRRGLGSQRGDGQCVRQIR